MILNNKGGEEQLTLATATSKSASHIHSGFLDREKCATFWANLSTLISAHRPPLTDVRYILPGSAGQFVSTQVPFNQMSSFLLSHTQWLAFSIVSSMFFITFLISAFLISMKWRRSLNLFQINPWHPTSIGKCFAIQPLSLHSVKRLA